MSNLNVFYQRLSTAQTGRNRYWDALFAIARATRKELGALSSDLSWQTWGEQDRTTVSIL